MVLLALTPGISANLEDSLADYPNIIYIVTIYNSIVMNLLLTELGYFGPMILSIIIVERIYNENKDKKIRHSNAIYFLILFWMFANEMLNRLLKDIIQQPRPEGIDYINFWDSPTSYGMPSGHEQTAAAAATFIILYFNNNILSTYAVAQSILTGYQRWYYRKHTLEQVIAGGIIGIIMGNVLYYILPRNSSEVTK